MITQWVMGNGEWGTHHCKVINCLMGRNVIGSVGKQFPMVVGKNPLLGVES